jgi:ATP-dependent protease ClpP protease subunit
MHKNIKTDELSQWHDYNVYTPARLINLEGSIDSDSASEFIKNIRLLDHVTDKDIIVLINSEGGSVSSRNGHY